MNVKTYRVNCLDCDAERVVKIANSPLGAQIDWLEDGKRHEIVSFRERLDGQYGWQCACGNNDLMTTQEKRSFSNPSAPRPQEVNQVVKNLVADKPKFVLKEA